MLAAGLGLSLALPADAEPGLTLFTHDSNDTITEDLIVVRLEGTIAAPMAETLAGMWAGRGPGHDRLLIDLDSPGGELKETEAMVAVIAAIREEAEVDTLVRHDAMCASACVAIFVQGAKRYAGGSSTWLFHGVTPHRSNVPNLGQTDRYLTLLRAAGVTHDFICRLVNEGHVTTPGKLWVSGYELVHVYQANIITDLIDPWRPEARRAPPARRFEPH